MFYKVVQLTEQNMNKQTNINLKARLINESSLLTNYKRINIVDIELWAKSRVVWLLLWYLYLPFWRSLTLLIVSCNWADRDLSWRFIASASCTLRNVISSWSGVLAYALQKAQIQIILYQYLCAGRWQSVKLNKSNKKFFPFQWPRAQVTFAACLVSGNISVAV